MILATSITPAYLEKSKPFFDSVNKYFDGKKICFTIGFKTDIEGWETVEAEPECKWTPENRKDYGCLQHGEFIKHYPFLDSDQVLFCDSDMILQREFKTNFKLEGFIVSDCSFPAQTLQEASENLGKKYSGQGKEFCTCWMLATAKDWKELFNKVRANYGFLNDYTHHAAWQLLINRIANKAFNVFRIDPVFCTADWYKGSEAVYEEGILKVKGETVFFNHHKFNV